MPNIFTSNKAAQIVVYILFLIALCIPVFSVEYPMSVDFLNHLSRQYIRFNYENSSVFKEYYYYNWIIVPNLSLDVVITLFMQFFSVYLAGKLSICFSLILWVLGSAALYYALWRKFSYIPLLCGFFAYNFMINWGFLGSHLAVGLSFFVFALWIYCVQEQVSLWKKTLIFIPLFLAVYISHLFIFMFLGLLIVLYNFAELQRHKQLSWKNFISTNLFIFALNIPGLGHFAYHLLTHGVSHGGASTAFSSMGISGFLNGIVDVSAPNASLISIGFLLAALYYVLTQKSKNIGLSFHPAMIIPVCVTGLVTLLIPSKVLGVFFIGERLPVIFICLLLLSFQINFEKKKTFLLSFIVFVTLFCAQIIEISMRWESYDQKMKLLKQAQFHMHEGAKLLTIFDDASFNNANEYKYFVHSPAIFTIEKEIFNPFIFTGMGEFFGVNDAYKNMNSAQAHNMALSFLYPPADIKVLIEEFLKTSKSSIIIMNWHEKYDYLLVANGEEKTTEIFDPLLQLEFENDFIRLYKILKDD